MKKIELTDATRPLADYVKEMDGMSIMIMYKGVALAALVPLDNADYETVSLSTFHSPHSMIWLTSESQQRRVLVIISCTSCKFCCFLREI